MKETKGKGSAKKHRLGAFEYLASLHRPRTGQSCPAREQELRTKEKGRIRWCIRLRLQLGEHPTDLDQCNAVIMHLVSPSLGPPPSAYPPINFPILSTNIWTSKFLNSFIPDFLIDTPKSPSHTISSNFSNWREI